MAIIIPFPETATTTINKLHIAYVNYWQALAWYQEVITCCYMYSPVTWHLFIRARDRKDNAEAMLREAML